MMYLNLGCGKNFHKDWTNIDFKSDSDFVQEHNLTNGIPYPSNTFEVVYHSHVLEHFTKEDGDLFIKECHRVLKPNGIIRIAVPDLEQIAKNYLIQLEKAWANEAHMVNYEWMVLELIDQLVRYKGGGEMGKYLYRNGKSNEKFLRSRAGGALDEYMEYFSNRDNKSKTNTDARRPGISRFFTGKPYLQRIETYLFKRELKQLGLSWEKYRNRQNMRRYRLSGEVHQWMYDRLSLRTLLEKNKFKDFAVVSAHKSNIPGWERFGLDVKDNEVRKPDSIFVEAFK